MTRGHAAAVWMDVRELQPWARNPVIHEAEQIAELEALIASSVWTAPIVARTSDRRVIAGHGRRLAALRAMERDPGWKLSDAPKPGMVPVRLVEVDDATADRLTLADNAMTKASAWDDAELAEILRGLGDAAEGIGFDEDEIAKLLNEHHEPPTIKVWTAERLESMERLVIRVDLPHRDRARLHELLEREFPGAELAVFLQFEAAQS